MNIYNRFLGGDPVTKKLEGPDMVCYTFYLCFFSLVWSPSRNNWGVCSAGNFAKKMWPFLHRNFYFYPKNVENAFFNCNL